jgi:hypothetical protein
VSILDRFRKGKKAEETREEAKTAKQLDELEQLCGDDKETYEALVDTMFLDPRKITISMKEATDDAKRFEKAGDLVRARISYEIAGGLAIYEGDAQKVTEYFGKCQRILPDAKYRIMKNPGKAVSIAQEYYRKYLKA